MYDIVAAGELLIDFTPCGLSAEGMPQYAQNPGGAPANALAAAAAWGMRTAFIGKVGDDAFGAFLRATIESKGVDAKGLIVTKMESTTLAFVHIDDTGDRSFSFIRKPGADMMIDESELDQELLRDCKVFHFGSVSMTHEGCRRAMLAAARAAKASGALVSFDPNYRQPIWQDPKIARRAILEAVPLADVLKVSEEEAEFLTGLGDWETAAGVLADMGPAAVLVSLGAGGSYYRCGAMSGHAAPFRVQAVDTTGSGDAFMGTVLAQLLLNGDGLAGPRALAGMPWARIAALANAAGALTATRKGAISGLPTRQEIEALAFGVADAR